MVKKVVQDDANTAESLGLVQVTLLEGQFRHNARTVIDNFIIEIIIIFFNVKRAKGQIPTYVWQEEMELTLVGLQVQKEFLVV